MRALPGVAQLSQKPSATALRIVPAVADAIPQNVLARPFIGEAWRFDGTAAPAGWMFAQGQTITVQDNPRLFSILGTIAGGNGKTTFMLPKPSFGVIIAVAGQFPSQPNVLAQSGRHVTHADSLGEGARPGVARTKKLSEKAVAQHAAERQLAASAVRVGRAFPVPVSTELAGRINVATVDARSAALDALSPDNRARLDAVVQGAVSGRVTVYEAMTEIMPSLSNAEANALVRINDAMIRAFNDRWQGTAPQAVQLTAATFLISVAITREQARTMWQRERTLR